MVSTGTERAQDTAQVLQQILTNTNVIAVKLFGSCDADNENQTGRLPKAEAELEAQRTRLDSIERKLIWYSGVASGALWAIEHLIKRLPF